VAEKLCDYIPSANYQACFIAELFKFRFDRLVLFLHHVILVVSICVFPSEGIVF